MAGSKSWFIYTDDDGEDFGVELDENIGSLPGLGFEPYTGSPPLDQLPRGTYMRYINAVQRTGAGAGFRYRSFPCGTDEADLFSGAEASFVVNGLGYSVTSTRGERSRKPTANNSGLIGPSSTVGVSSGGGA